jgi:hypothetical protein
MSVFFLLSDGRSQSDRLQAVRQHVFPRLRHVLDDWGGRRQGRGAGGGRLPHVAVLVSVHPCSSGEWIHKFTTVVVVSGYLSLPL